MADKTAKRRDLRIASAIAVGFFALYLLTLCRTVFWYDSAEYVTAAVTLGIPHPPGYPLYTLLAHLFTWLPVDAAIAVNAMSSTAAAVCVGLIYLVGRRLGLRALPAAIGAASLGASKLFWMNAVIAEVYCPALACIAGVTLLLLRYRNSGRLRTALAAALVAGLGLGIHLSIATTGLGLALLVWARATHVGHPRQLGELFRKKSLTGRVGVSAAALGAAAIGSLIFLYLPLRASMQPELNFGDPSTLERFIWHITGGNYKEWFNQDVGFLDRTSTIIGFMETQFLIVGLFLAAAGGLALIRRRPVEGGALVLMMLGNLYYFFDYTVHDLDVFFLPTTLVVSLLIGAGSQLVIDGLATVVSKAKVQGMQRLMSAALAAYVVSLGVGHFRGVDMSEFDDTNEFIEDILSTLPADAVILNFTTPNEWKMNAVFGMYTQKVKKLRTDVTVMTPRSPKEVFDMLAEGKSVFAYVPLRALRGFELRKDGPLIKVLGPRRAPTPAPRP